MIGISGVHSLEKRVITKTYQVIGILLLATIVFDGAVNELLSDLIKDSSIEL